MATDKKTGFYSLKDLLKTNPDIAMCIGMRSNGKTYACLEYYLKEFKKTIDDSDWIEGSAACA